MYKTLVTIVLVISCATITNAASIGRKIYSNQGGSNPCDPWCPPQKCYCPHFCPVCLE